MSKKKSCGVIYVEEHTKCNCGCLTAKEQCTNRQDFISDECRCVCKANGFESCTKEVII